MEEDKVSVEIEQQLPDFIPEDSVIQKDTNDVYGKKIVAEPKPSASVGADIDEKFFQDIIAANENNALDVSAVQSFTQLAQSRDSLYKLLDDMADDPTVAAILRAYVENAVEPNENGQVVWVESSDADCAKMVEFLLEAMDVDKNSYEWVMRLCKYGDLYLHLFRKSELQDELFKTKEPEEDKFDQYYNGLSEKERKSLNEDILIRAYSKNDHYSHYVEAEANPAEHFELVKHGKSCGYITADISTNVFTDDNPNLTQLRYGFKKQDVIVDEATEFVHACLDSGVSRVPETVDIFLTDKTDINAPKASYTVRKGRSLLYDAYQSWRLLSLLENSLLLNRVTKSQLIRLITMDVGGMPQEDVAPLMQALKKQLEQKTAINVSKYLEEYTNPGAIENNVYWTTRNGLGGISIQNIGGDYDPKSLIDLDYFKNKMFGAFSVPKQFFCLRGDTEILLLNGHRTTIKDLFENRERYIGRGIMACNPDGSLCPTRIKDIMLTRPKATFVRVHLDNGEYVDVTPDHRMMMRDGTFKEASLLNPGDRLMPYYDKIEKSRRLVLDNKTGKYRHQYRVVQESVEEVPKGYQVHHKNHIKIDDDFDNLVTLSIADHYKEHEEGLHETARVANAERKSLGEHSKQFGKISITNGIENHWISSGAEIPDGWRRGLTTRWDDKRRQAVRNAILRTYELHPELKYAGGIGKGMRTPEQLQQMSDIRKKYFDSMTPEEREAHREYRRSVAARTICTEEVKRKLLDSIPADRRVLERTLRCPVCGSVFIKKMNIGEYQKYLNKEHFIFCCKEHERLIGGRGKLGRSFQTLLNTGVNYDAYENLRCSGVARRDFIYKASTLKPIVEEYALLDYNPECNHVVESVEYLDVEEPAYDIEVEADCHTFALPCGIFVHNCETDDSTGFNGGSSLSIISSQFAKKVKSVQNAFLQGLTDAINFMFIDKRLNRYVNNFKLKMTPPITQEELDRRENAKNGIGVAQDVLNMLDGIEDPVLVLKIKKAMLSKTLTDSEVINLIQDQIDQLEKNKEEQEKAEQEGQGVSEDSTEIEPVEDTGGESTITPAEEATTETETPSLSDAVESGTAGSETILPTADELGVDMTGSED